MGGLERGRGGLCKGSRGEGGKQGTPAPGESKPRTLPRPIPQLGKLPIFSRFVKNVFSGAAYDSSICFLATSYTKYLCPVLGRFREVW